ncbi:MAG TPA: hypothetical protein PKX07_22105, partial [Aggregatilineales bacterium]|nr:hypothetical protein [Aggregatilineales bacterium]
MPTDVKVDPHWMLAAAALIFVVQAGFLCLEAGLTRAKNNLNVALKKLAELGIVTLIFWAFAFALMFGP